MMTQETNDEAFPARHFGECIGDVADDGRAGWSAAALPDRKRAIPFARSAGGEWAGRESPKSRSALDA
jgi:hypothetical protein